MPKILSCMHGDAFPNPSVLRLKLISRVARFADPKLRLRQAGHQRAPPLAVINWGGRPFVEEDLGGESVAHVIGPTPGRESLPCFDAGLGRFDGDGKHRPDSVGIAPRDAGEVELRLAGHEVNESLPARSTNQPPALPGGPFKSHNLRSLPGLANDLIVTARHKKDAAQNMLPKSKRGE